jgi:hypothetical protein
LAWTAKSGKFMKLLPVKSGHQKGLAQTITAVNERAITAGRQILFKGMVNSPTFYFSLNKSPLLSNFNFMVLSRNVNKNFLTL